MDTSGSPYQVYPGDINLIIKPGRAFVDRFVFANYTDPEHRCRVIDGKDRDVFNVRGRLDFAPVQIAVDSPGGFQDMLLLELGSGQLYVYIK